MCAQSVQFLSAKLFIVQIPLPGHFQDNEAGWVVAAVASGAIVGGTERAGEAEVNGGTNEPAEAAFDVALTRQPNGTRGERIMREPAARRLRERCCEDLAIALVEGLGMGDKRVEVIGRELLVAKR